MTESLDALLLRFNFVDLFCECYSLTKIDRRKGKKVAATTQGLGKLVVLILPKRHNLGNAWNWFNLVFEVKTAFGQWLSDQSLKGSRKKPVDNISSIRFLAYARIVLFFLQVTAPQPFCLSRHSKKKNNVTLWYNSSIKLAPAFFLCRETTLSLELNRSKKNKRL